MNNYIITSGTGCGSSELTSFDNSLYNSGIANYNLVKVSSILPANAIEQKKIGIDEGNVLFTAYASISSNTSAKVCAATIAVGIPEDKTKIGVIMEYSGYCSSKETERVAKKMVKEAMDKRNYKIGEIKVASAEVFPNESNSYFTAFACISMW